MTEAQATPTERSRATRAAVLEAALEVFLGKSFHRATVDDITRRAAVAHGTFYRYFCNKQDALNSLVQEAMTRIPHPDHDLASADVLHIVETEIAAFFSNVAANRDLYRIWDEASAYDETIAERRTNLRRPFVSRIRESIQASVGLSLIPPIDAEVASEALACMVEHFGYTWFVVERREGDVGHLADTLALIWYRGLGYGQGRHSL